MTSKARPSPPFSQKLGSRTSTGSLIPSPEQVHIRKTKGRRKGRRTRNRLPRRRRSRTRERRGATCRQVPQLTTLTKSSKRTMSGPPSQERSSVGSDRDVDNAKVFINLIIDDDSLSLLFSFYSARTSWKPIKRSSDRMAYLRMSTSPRSKRRLAQARGSLLVGMRCSRFDPNRRIRLVVRHRYVNSRRSKRLLTTYEKYCLCSLNSR